MAGPARVTFADSAVVDLEKLLSYCQEQLVPDVGVRLLGEIIGRIADLEINPEMGRVVPEFGRENLRELIQPPFRIVYRHERAKVRIVRVWRSERLLKLPG